MELKLITSNVSADFLTPPGVPTWDERKMLYAQVVRQTEANLIGFQEATLRQFAFWQAELPGFTPLTVPVIDPDPAAVAVWEAKYGRFGLPTIPSPYEILLFYHTPTFELLESGHWWLSPTPERPSIGFGNVAPRAVLWAHLHHYASGNHFVVFNTHIDHRCPDPMVALCRQKFTTFAARTPSLIFMGDFNFNPTTATYALLMQDGWQDAYITTPETNTFLYDLPGIPGGRIDHVLYQGNFTPLAWARLTSPYPDKRLSDHDPVFVKLRHNRG